MQSASLSTTLLLQTAPYLPLGPFTTALTEQVDCKMPAAQTLSAPQETDNAAQHRPHKGSRCVYGRKVHQDMPIALPPLPPVLTVAPSSNQVTGSLQDPQAVSTPGSADSSSTAKLSNVAIGAANASGHTTAKQGQLLSTSGAGCSASGTGSPAEHTASAGPADKLSAACVAQRLLQRLHCAQESAAGAGDQVVPVAAVLERPKQKHATTAAPAEQQGDVQHVASERVAEQDAAAAEVVPAVADVDSHVRPQGAVCDSDALEAAAQLLLLHSAAAEVYQEYAGDAATAAAATAGDQTLHYEQPHATAVVDHTAAVDCDCQQLRHQLAGSDQQQPPKIQDVHADRLMQQQQQQQQQQVETDVHRPLGFSAQERRSKRARKTSYKAAMAAESEGALTEYLQKSAGRSSSSSKGSAVKAAHGSAGSAAAADIEQQGDQVVTNSLTLAAQEHKHARKPVQQQRNPGESTGQQDEQHQHQHTASRSSSAGARIRTVASKRCVVRTSLVPVGTAVQQKLQHVVSFFPDMQLPGATVMTNQQQLDDRIVAAPPAAGADASTAVVAVCDSSRLVASIAKGDRGMRMDTELAEQPLLQEQHQLDDGHEARDQSDHPFSSKAEAPVAVATAAAAAAAAAGASEETIVQQQQQELPVSASAVGDRPRRKRKPVSSRYSPPPLPAAATPAAVTPPRSKQKPDNHMQQELEPPGKKQHTIASTVSIAADSADVSAPSTTPSQPAAAAEGLSPSVDQNPGGSVRNKGGRPRGSGNKHQMAPRSVDRSGKTGFALRSAKYTGVYQSRRAHEGWRAQFCFSNKVLNLGTYATEDDAARAWNAAALFFRGSEAWMNPVQPRLPEDFVPGSLGRSVPAATVTAAAAVAARAKQ